MFQERSDEKFQDTDWSSIRFLFSSCSNDAPPNRDCPLATLMVNINLFSIHTGRPKMDVPAPKFGAGTRGIESALQEYLLGMAYPSGTARATQEIQRWSDVSVAQRDYVDRRDFALLTDNRVGPWSLPSAITYTTRYADETEIKCGKVEISRKTYRCWMVGRYQEYVVIFETEIVSGVLSHPAHCCWTLGVARAQMHSATSGRATG